MGQPTLNKLYLPGVSRSELSQIEDRQACRWAPLVRQGNLTLLMLV